MRAREHISDKVKQCIYAEQGGCCFYCGLPFGEYVYRRGRLVLLGVQYDHVVPYSWEHNNSSNNLVAACQVCNGIKSNLMFETIEDAQSYVLARWTQKGYRLARDRDMAYAS